MPMKKSPLKSNVPLKAKVPIKVNLKPKKQVKPSVSKLKKIADALHSKATRLRFAEWIDSDWWAQCITCKMQKPISNLQCGHFMSRMHNNTRYDEENTAPQCYGCNVMHQGRQYEFGQQIDMLYGNGTAKKLYKLAQQPHQFTVQELEEIIADRKEEIMFYERGILHE